MADGTIPTYTQQVNMSVFVEPLGGPKNPLNALDRFPDAIYHKSPDTHFVRFMYSLLGPAGLGWIKKQYLDAKLALYAQGFNSFQIERYYGDPFRFGRILEEELPEDPEGLLTREQWDTIKAKDESYRNRAITFFHAARAGGTPEGMELAAQSGLNHSAFVWENYKSLFDSHADAPLGLPHYGRTESTEEFVVIPRQTASRSEQQIISFAEVTAVKGTFQFEFNGQRTNLLPYNANNFEVEAALEGLGNIGHGNIVVSGGPNPNPFIVTFCGALSDQDVPTLKVISNVLNNLSEPITMYVRVLVGGIETVDETVVFSDEYQHNAQTAIDYLRPLNSLPTPRSGSGTRTRQGINKIHASSSYVEAVKFITGSESVNWPEPDSMNWIKAGKELESKRIQGDLQAHYVSYHTISDIASSSDHIGRYDVRATANFPFLSSINEDLRTFKAKNAVPACASPMAITSNVETEKLFPLIEGQIYSVPVDSENSGTVALHHQTWWSSQERAAPTPEALEIDLGEARMINWISFDITRKPSYIRVDFDRLDDGEDRDWEPVSLWKVGPDTTAIFNGEQYHAAITFAPTLPPWQTVKIFFKDSEQHNIASRFLRLTFSRPAPGERGQEPFTDPVTHTPIPYSIDVRNLRTGRYAGTTPTWSY